MRKAAFLLILAVLSASTLSGQVAPSVFDAAEKKAAIDALCKNLEQEYIFPDVTAKYVRMLRDNLKSGKYDGIGQPQEFAAAVTNDLMSVHRDLHLSLRFNPNWVKEERNRKELDEEAIRRNERRSRASNYGFNEIKILPGNIGYLKLDEFTYDTGARDAAVGAMSLLSNADALIIDLRTNGGGSPEMVQFLCSYFLANPRQHLNSFSYKDPDKLTQYWTYTYLPGKRLDQADLYLLTSESTFSAAEEFTYNLKNLKRATVIGETTGGGAHDNKFVALTDNFMMSLPFARAVNPITKSNWEEVGVEPDIKVAQSIALATAQALASRKLAEKEKDPEFKAYYQWHHDAYNAVLHPVTIGPEASRSYVGTYGPRTITLEGELLFYQRQGQTKMKMTLIGDDCFMVEGNDNFRLKFIKEGERIVAVEGRNPSGAVDRHPRSK
ncbi:MAG: S41 family peptidase [Candidatus Aminicenantes bacterium]|nr:S41 family peptidase [Candidatus Aminicenantes bacterium]